MAKKFSIIVLFVVAVTTIIIGFGLWQFSKEKAPSVINISNFQECADAGYPVAESYPRQCAYKNQTFVEYIGNDLEKADLIRLDSPRPNEVVSSPLTVKGSARGTWFFEASFPVFLVDWDGRIIAQGIATAKSDWMTTDFVAFEATLDFAVDENVYSNRGSLILKKDNPSGLPEHDDALEIPIIYQDINSSSGSGILPFDSGVAGQVLLGPMCPVMKDPPDLSCADKPYQITIQVVVIGSPQSSPFATVETDKDGNYKIMLPPGEYALNPIENSQHPICESISVTVKPNLISNANISCDTGIR